MSLSTLDWDDSMLDLFGIRRETLAEAIYPSDHIFCHWRGIPVTGVMGDSHAALYGNGCHRVGEAKATYGTGSSVMQNIGNSPVFAPGLSHLRGFSQQGWRSLRPGGKCYLLGGYADLPL